MCSIKPGRAGRATGGHPTAYIVAACDTLEAQDDAQTVCRDLPARTLVRGIESSLLVYRIKR